jgi:hypothetical protein
LGWQRAVADLLTAWREMYRREYAWLLAYGYEWRVRQSDRFPAARRPEAEKFARDWAQAEHTRQFWKCPFGATAMRLHNAFAERGCQQYARWGVALVSEDDAGPPPAATPQEEAVALRAVIHALDWPPGYEPYPIFDAPHGTYERVGVWPPADRRNMEELHWRAFQLAQARLDILEAAGAPMTVGRARAPLSKEEREALVRDYLKAHKARAARGEVSIREVSEETCVPVSSIQGTVAWTALQDRLDHLGRSKRPRKRRAQAYTPKMDAAVEDVRLNELVGEQAADDDASPHDRGRRGNVRVRKKV